MQEYTINEAGEKVLAGSRRPDGTLRKERRIRAGYTPQDEQPVYTSTGTMAKMGVPKCPGLDPEQAAAATSSSKSKAAKKNEKRKAKKAEGATGGGTTPASSSSSTAAPAPAPPSSGAAAPPAAQTATGTAAPAADAGAVALDKQIKNLSKKVRQCQALVDRQAAGEALSPQEQEKVSKMAAWQEEIKQLEHQMAKLGA